MTYSPLSGARKPDADVLARAQDDSKGVAPLTIGREGGYARVWLARLRLRLFAVLCVFPFVAVPGQVPAQDPASAPNATPVHVGEGTPDCRRCHYCEQPSAEARCLRDTCTRDARSGAPGEVGPNVVILDVLVRDFLPVPFDHAGHARMAAMGQGCVTCHHHTPGRERPPACVTCHDPAVEGTDPQKPGLKGAYHQQCLNCHREWIDETACEVCHLPKSGRRVRVAPSGFPTTDEILRRMHPPIPAPTGELYGGSGSLEGRVLFGHARHVDYFGIACVDCHHEPSCARCHAVPANARPGPTLVEHHRPCVRCHKEDMDLTSRSAGHCERCHWPEGAPRPAAFDHASSGWPLGRFHEGMSCRGCHADVPFKRLDARCEACHKAWTPVNFDHSVTGQVLDEIHISLDCEECHPERRYDSPPRCDECHSEEEDAIAFPARRPGPSRAAG